ncbi:holin family protein [Sphingomonas sp. LHG3406-1]|uniref:holin family protein n=1 Tax=Sphingomonas sp. LHG3406-1 TaxID=2804617 RepID=UPI00262387D4|nr:holin family protein [Sphingomonas sp. LHG3406-1]
MPLIEAIVAPLAKLIDKIIPDPQARDRAKLELLKLQGDQEAAQIGQQMQAIIAEANSADPWTSRARPSFLYVMYALMLWSIPMGLIAAANPATAAAIATGMTDYLRNLPNELYTLFGTGYLGYTAARTWGKVKGVER